MTNRAHFDAHTMATAGEVPSEDRNRRLWLVLRRALLMICAAIQAEHGRDR